MPSNRTRARWHISPARLRLERIRLRLRGPGMVLATLMAVLFTIGTIRPVWSTVAAYPKDRLIASGAGVCLVLVAAVASHLWPGVRAPWRTVMATWAVSLCAGYGVLAITVEHAYEWAPWPTLAAVLAGAAVVIGATGRTTRVILSMIRDIWILR